MKILILGADGSYNRDLSDSIYCFDMLSNGIYNRLTSLGIDCYIIPAGKFHGDNYDTELLQPDTDLILFIGYAVTKQMNFERLKQDTGAKKVFSLLEVPVDGVDWSFYFVSTNGEREDRKTKIFAPCDRSMYMNMPKVRNSILIDHSEENANNRWDGKRGDTDWTERISDWLSNLTEDYTIYRMTRFGEKLKLNEHEIISQPFKDYLEVTNNIENYIVTHAEGYGYSVIDMVVRGIRVIAPEGFLNPEFVREFRIPTFTNQRELLDILAEPPDEWWSGCIYQTNDYIFIATRIIERHHEMVGYEITTEPLPEVPEVIDYSMLDLGSGAWRKRNHIGIDNLEAAEFQGMTEEDKKWIIPWDLNKSVPYPPNCISDIYCSHFLEHVIDPYFLLQEIWRVCYDKAHVTFVVPLHEMISVGHITEFDSDWFERAILERFPGMFAIVRKSVLKDKPVDLRQPDGTTIPRTFDELAIVMKIIK